MIGLLFGSGGFRGAARIEILDRLRTLRLSLHAMAGWSIGRLIAARQAAPGLPVEYLLEDA